MRDIEETESAVRQHKAGSGLDTAPGLFIVYCKVSVAVLYRVSLL